METTNNMPSAKAKYGYELWVRYNGNIKLINNLLGQHTLSDRMVEHYKNLYADGRREYVPMNKFTYGLA